MKKLVSLLVAILALAVFAAPADARSHSRNRRNNFYQYGQNRDFAIADQRVRNTFMLPIRQMERNLNYSRYYTSPRYSYGYGYGHGYRYGRRSRLSSGEVLGTAAVVAGAIVLDRALERRHERNELLAPNNFEPSETLETDSATPNVIGHQQEELGTKKVAEKVKGIPVYVPQPPPPNSNITINISPWCLLGIGAAGLALLLAFGFGLLVASFIR